MSTSAKPATLHTSVAGPAGCCALSDFSMEASHLAQVVNDATFPVAILNSEIRFVYVNEATAVMLQRRPEELIGRPLRDAFQTDKIELYEARLRRVLEGGETHSFDDEVIFPGGRCWLSSVLAPVQLPGERLRGAMVVSIDITARKEVEAQLFERIRFEELVTDVSSDFVRIAEAEIPKTLERTLRRIGEFMLVDRAFLLEFSQDGAFLNGAADWAAVGVAPANPRFERLPCSRYPWLLEQLRAGKVLAINRVADLPEEAAMERQELPQNGVQSFVWLPLRFADRTVGALCLESLRAPRNWSEQFVLRLEAVANIIANAYQRSMAERELAKSREFIEAVTACSPHICYVYDRVMQRNIYSSNPIWLELGYKPDDVGSWEDHLLSKLLHPDDLEKWPGFVSHWECVDDKQVIESEYRMRRADGHWRWFLGRAKVFQRGPDGEVTQFIGWAEDITDRKLAEVELQRRRAELSNRNRLSTLGEMATGVAHELSQPLYAVVNFVKAAENMIEQHGSPEVREVAKWLEQAATAASSAGQIIHRLRTFARVQTPQCTVQPVVDIVNQTVSLLQFELQRRETRISLAWGGEPSVVLRADRVQIEQVLINLIQNGCDAMEKLHPKDRVIILGVLCQDRQVEFFVRDRGTGLPDSGTNIFEPFVTTKAHGLGLGLAISKTIVEEHNGRLWAKQNPDAGATFHFIIPFPLEA